MSNPKFNIFVESCLTRHVELETDNATDLGETIERYDNEFHREHLGYDTSNVNWEDEFCGNDHLSPMQLINKYAEELRNRINLSEKRNIRDEWLLEECESWEEESFEAVLD